MALATQVLVGARFAQSLTMLTILLIVVVLMALGSLPAWPHSRSWGYYPSGGLGLVLVIVLLFFFFSPHHAW